MVDIGLPAMEIYQIFLIKQKFLDLKFYQERIPIKCSKKKKKINLTLFPK